MPRKLRERIISWLLYSQPACSIEVFDFEKKWPQIIPFLDHAKVEAALVAEGFDSNRGPWTDSAGDYWQLQASMRAFADIKRGQYAGDWDNPSPQDLEKVQKLETVYTPKRQLFEWYQCVGGARRLAPFLLELGQLVYPKLSWGRFTGRVHSCAYGSDKTGNIKVIFDILLFKTHTAVEIIELCTQLYPTPEATIRAYAAAESRVRAEEAALAAVLRPKRIKPKDDPDPGFGPDTAGTF